MAINRFVLVLRPDYVFEVHSFGCKTRLADARALTFHSAIPAAIEQAPADLPVTVMPCTKGGAMCALADPQAGLTRR